MPWYAEYDYVEAYDYDEGTDSFQLRFRDDFDTLDESRWDIVNYGGFEANSCTFMSSHVYVRDGKLVLKMDKTMNEVRPEFDEVEEIDECGEVNLSSDTLVYGDLCDSKHDRS